MSNYGPLSTVVYDGDGEDPTDVRVVMELTPYDVSLVAVALGGRFAERGIPDAYDLALQLRFDQALMLISARRDLVDDAEYQFEYARAMEELRDGVVPCPMSLYELADVMGLSEIPFGL